MEIQVYFFLYIEYNFFDEFLTLVVRARDRRTDDLSKQVLEDVGQVASPTLSAGNRAFRAFTMDSSGVFRRRPRTSLPGVAQGGCQGWKIRF
ncbi:MAG: hypothetical protein C4530_16530 [Desulfobacteraceae bacterium]|nr:MAG: hypothetical protein C4530_16530 [Desulfobacteraceae bacterium]